MSPAQAVVLLAALAVAAYLLRRYLPDALKCVWPSSLRLEVDAPRDAVKVPLRLHPLHDELTALGFELVGSFVERPWLGPQRPCLAYAAPTHGVFAATFVASDLRPRLDLFSFVGEGGVALTSSYRRPAREDPGRYLAGGMENTTVERVLNAHVRRSHALGVSLGPYELEPFVERLNDWLRGSGGKDLRAQNAPALLWSAFSLGMVAAAFFALL